MVLSACNRLHTIDRRDLQCCSFTVCVRPTLWLHARYCSDFLVSDLFYQNYKVGTLLETLYHPYLIQLWTRWTQILHCVWHAIQQSMLGTCTVLWMQSWFGINIDQSQSKLTSHIYVCNNRECIIMWPYYHETYKPLIIVMYTPLLCHCIT